ncbi:MAG: hypothetical protein U5R06_12885 [candidate division KSB1 bacterium]|nr:hypothetical protein [candidate division KSB1 bacterium]
MNMLYDKMNVGCVVYKKDVNTGKLFADWKFEYQGNCATGRGIGIGPIGNDYKGKYSIIYYNEQGESNGEYLLTITNDNKIYKLEWYQDEIMKCYGIGMMHDDLLIAGWIKTSII